jgi:hypothetical protein
VTLHLVDVSKYQVERPDPLNLALAQGAGFNAINVALDRGRAEDVLPTWARSYVDTARDRGMGVSCYRWVDARISGKESADRAYDRMRQIGGPDGIAHAADVESDAPYEVVRDYVDAMQQHLQRHVFLYTADWWWLNPARRWDGASMTPYLWAAPNDGYLTAYPGDVSPHWTAGYGGWGSMSALQYAVKPLPGTGNCSLSAIRDLRVWEALTGTGEGGSMRSANMQVLTNQLKAKYPGVVIYGIGDAAHKLSPSGHNEDDTPGSLPEDQDADSKPEHRALDVMKGNAFSHADAVALVTAMTQVPANQRRLLYVIYNRKIYRRNSGWREENYTGSDPHTSHVHLSGEADDDENTAAWILDIGDADMNAEQDKILREAHAMLDRIAWDMHGIEMMPTTDGPEGQVVDGGPLKGRMYGLGRVLQDIVKRVTVIEEAVKSGQVEGGGTFTLQDIEDAAFRGAQRAEKE